MQLRQISERHIAGGVADEVVVVVWLVNVILDVFVDRAFVHVTLQGLLKELLHIVLVGLCSVLRDQRFQQQIHSQRWVMTLYSGLTSQSDDQDNADVENSERCGISESCEIVG